MIGYIAKRMLSTSRVNFTSKLWKVDVSHSREALTFESAANGESLKFPSVWLRDNCQCSKCYDKALHSRLTPYRYFKARILPLNVTVSVCTFIMWYLFAPATPLPVFMVFYRDLFQCLESKDGNVRFRVEWPDQHESVYELEWLREYDFNSEAQKKWLNFYHFEKLTWNAENFRKILRYFSYESLMNRWVHLKIVWSYLN